MLYPCPVLMGLDLIITLMLSSHYNESVVHKNAPNFGSSTTWSFPIVHDMFDNLQILWHFSNKVVFVEVVYSSHNLFPRLMWERGAHTGLPSLWSWLHQHPPCQTQTLCACRKSHQGCLVLYP